LILYRQGSGYRGKNKKEGCDSAGPTDSDAGGDRLSAGPAEGRYSLAAMSDEAMSDEAMSDEAM